MKDDLSLVVSGNDDDESFVQVPIRKKDFGDFITNLLGQPEKIQERKSGTFEATFEWLVHIHHLLNQRIKQQNHADLVDFSATFRYNSGPERKITTINGFLNFNEAKIVSTKSLEITWTYLVRYPNKPSPEKQEITLALITDHAEVVTVSSTSIIKNTTSKKGVISYAISHTERTWGDDIQTLLDNEIESLFEKEPWYSKVLAVTLLFLMLGFFASGLLIPDYIEQLIREKEWAAIYASLVPQGSTIESLSVNEKLDLALRLLDPTNQLHNTGGWFRIASFIAGVSLAVFTAISFERSRPSFIVVTSEDRKRRDKHKNKDRKSMALRILSFCAAVAAGVAGNYLYYYFSLP